MLICSFTTLGKTFAATCSTEPSRGAARGGCGAGAAGRRRVGLVGEHRRTDAAGHHGDRRGANDRDTSPRGPTLQWNWGSPRRIILLCSGVRAIRRLRLLCGVTPVVGLLIAAMR